MTLLVFKHTSPSDPPERDEALEGVIPFPQVMPQIGDRIMDTSGAQEWRVYDRGLYPTEGKVTISLCPHNVDPEYFRRTSRQNDDA